MIITCIYHANCVDGFTAAWAVYHATHGAAKTRFIPASYGDAPPPVVNYAGTHVVIVDFSYPRDVLEDIAQRALSVVVLDHHKTAAQNLDGLTPPAVNWESHLEEWAERAGTGHTTLCADFDMDRSGAQMAWDFFHDASRPPLVDYVGDRDLWAWKLPHSRAVSAYLSSWDFDFGRWDQIAAKIDGAMFPQLCKEGSGILRKQRRDIAAQIDASRRYMTIGGHRVPVANMPPFWASDGAGSMAADMPDAPFAATYYDGPKGRAFSLRSRGDFDVSVIAESYGGGGHKAAAGFLRPHGWEGDSHGITITGWPDNIKVGIDPAKQEGAGA